VNCPKCGTANGAGAIHCSNCGSELIVPRPPETSAAATAVLAFFMLFVGLIAGAVAFVLVLTFNAWALGLAGQAATRFGAVLWMAEAIIIGAGVIVLLVRVKPPVPVVTLVVGIAIPLIGGLALCSGTTGTSTMH
jgi:hypothetical protein